MGKALFEVPTIEETGNAVLRGQGAGTVAVASDGAVATPENAARAAAQDNALGVEMTKQQNGNYTS